MPPPQNVHQQHQQQHQGPSPPPFQQDPQVQTQPPQQQQLPPTHREQSPPQGHQIQAQPLVQQQPQQQPQQQQSIRPQGSITRKPPGGAAPPQQAGAADEAPVKNGVKSVPEPTTPADGSRLTVNVHKANQDNHDDIYDATPRKQPLERQRTGESQISISSTEEAARKANGVAKKSKAPAKVIRVNSTRAELEDTEDERRRTLRLEAQEEKILYDPNEDGPSGGRRKEEAEAPQMSATSYPGMEWNPYANGNYDDWND
ncbi:hypothetical protein F5X68DRAFT_204654 [Plectosphaerella plurivora]|uniref:Uncharacterized protein n=1 Tax=Plectosphaerella plurivora TaxID=936078 RepID=A0A9P8VCV5_9PEZI|nr:hypothetical protein F5X68DRAFT_204654 [Plectosphaerella plurivora]